MTIFVRYRTTEGAMATARAGEGLPEFAVDASRVDDGHGMTDEAALRIARSIWDKLP